jgi:hypothetical protein
MYCQTCGNETPDQGLFCLRCGTHLNKECPRCAEIIKYKAKVCRFCGYEFTAEENAELERIDQERILRIKAEQEKKIEEKLDSESLRSKTNTSNFSKKIEAIKRLGSNDTKETVTKKVNYHGRLSYIVGNPEGQLSLFQCPWCDETYEISEEGGNVFFDCEKCHHTVLVTRG